MMKVRLHCFVKINVNSSYPEPLEKKGQSDLNMEMYTKWNSHFKYYTRISLVQWNRFQKTLLSYGHESFSC